MNSIINDIIASYNSLWKIKMHGNTVEIITPVATTNNIFVSVFLTRRGEDFIVTDGGWIDSGVYECKTGIEDPYYQKLFLYYMDDYEIQYIEAKSYIYYYKKISNPKLVPNLVYDLSSFINAVVSASFISFEEKKEREHTYRFRRNATNYIKTLVEDKHLKTNCSIHEGLGLIKFSAVVFRKNRMTLVNYVTGSNESYFVMSLGRSNLNYDMVEKHSINNLVERKITLMDDTTKIINSPRIVPYLGVVSSKEGRISLKWGEKEHLKELVE